MNERVTIYNYKLDDKQDEAGFLACSGKVDQLIQQLPGFLYRSLGKTEDGVWVDVNYWGADADSAAIDELFHKDAVCQQFMSMIEQDSVNVQRNEVVSTIMCAEAAA